MDQLRHLGLNPGWIYEALVCTYLDGVPHAAPTGIATDDFERIRLDLFDGSRTLDALAASADFAVALPAGAEALFRALYAPGELSFTRASVVDAPSVAGSAATIELRMLGLERREHRTRVIADVVAVTRRTDVRLINRAEPLLVEALILATRIDLARREQTLATLDEQLRVAEKVAPGSPAAVALRRLRLRFDQPS